MTVSEPSTRRSSMTLTLIGALAEPTGMVTDVPMEL